MARIAKRTATGPAAFYDHAGTPAMVEATSAILKCTGVSDDDVRGEALYG